MTTPPTAPPPVPPPMFNDALALLRAGRAAEAATLFLQLAEQRPGDAGVWVNLGVAQRAAGNKAAAVEALSKGTKLDPYVPEAWFNFGNALEGVGDLAGAEEAFSRALVLRPKFGAAAYNFALMLQRQSRFHEALEHFEVAVAELGNLAKVHRNRSQCLRAVGRFEEARASHEQARRIDPTIPPEAYPEPDKPRPDSVQAAQRASALYTANALLKRGEALQALRTLEGLAVSFPGDSEIENALAQTAQAAGMLVKSRAVSASIVAREPRNAKARARYGVLLAESGRADRAIEHLEFAARLAPADNEIALQRALVYARAEQFLASAEASKVLVARDPNNVLAMVNMGHCLSSVGALAEAEVVHRAVLAREPMSVNYAGNMLLTLSYRGDLSPGKIADEHRAWGQGFESQVKIVEGTRQKIANGKKLKVAYISGDLWGHSVAFFLEPILEHRDRALTELFLYSNGTRRDHYTDSFRAMADHWRQVNGLDDDAVARLIVSDGIDILVDLSGHTAANRLGVFARKPAPIQVSYLGYPNTTGLSRIDYYLTDGDVDPPGAHDDLFSEKLWRLPRHKLCYRAPHLPPVEEPAFRKNGYITFGSFNNAAKYNPEVFALWARLLTAVPSARLRLKASLLGEAAVRDRIWAHFSRAGIERGRVELVAYDHHMGDLDICLDPFPYNGATTTCQAFHMGLPVVTMRGASHAACVGAAILKAIGLPDLVGANGDDYIAIAKRLAEDRGRLVELRGSLRQRLKDSPLGDERDMARAVDDAWQAMADRARR